MPPRLSKRQQRELEEMEALASVQSPIQKDPLSDEAAEEESKPVKPPAKSAFALLAATNAAEQSEEEEEEEIKTTSNKKKKKKKKTGTSEASPAPSTPKSPPKGGSTKKKGKGQAKEDDLDRALAELSLKYSDITIPDPSTSKPTAPALASALQNLRALLALQPKFLDPDAEMRKFFGSKVISAAESSTSSPPGYASPRGPVARSTLCKPQKAWPPAGLRDGLTMRLLTADELRGREEKGKQPDTNWLMMSGDKWFTVEHSPSYRWDQAQFMQAVRMLDPNNLFALMRESWWHVDMLLQIAEVYRAQDDYSMSSDFTSRALFAYERSFTGAFNLGNGASRLDFRKVENRSLFLGLHRTILYLERRGTMRTAFEFVRLLWSLDPWNDPHGALLHLDFLLVKAEQFEWLLEMEQAWEDVRNEMPSLPPLETRPSWRWTKALALKTMGVKKGGGEKKATEELKAAIHAFPEVLVALSQQVTISIPSTLRLPQASSRWSRSDEQDSTVWLLSHTYAHRSVSLWKIPETLAWLNSTLQTLASDRPTLKSNAPAYSPSFIKSVMRHAIVSDIKGMAPFIGSLQSAIGTQEGYDIVPPEGEGVTAYDEQYFALANAETAKKRREGATPRQGRRNARQGVQIDPVMILESLEAILNLDVNDPGRNDLLRAFEGGNGAAWIRDLERWVRDHADFAEQFPNALAYLRAPAAQRPRALAPDPGQNDPGAFVGPIPGAFAGDVVEEREGLDAQANDEEEDSEGEDVPILPVRLARRLVGMLWGPGAAPEDEEETTSDEDIDFNAPHPAN